MIGLAIVCSALTSAQVSRCTSKERTTSYAAYYDARQSTEPASQRKAYEAAQSYMEQWAKCDDQYAKSAKEFIDFYELTQARLELHGLIFGSTPGHSLAFAVGKKILGRQPEDLYTLMSLSFAGNAALQKGVNTFVGDTLNYATRATHLIETGKTATNWAPFKNKEDALAYLYYWIAEAYWPTRKDPGAALPFYLKAATIDSALKKDASVYARLASVYQLSVYDKVREQYRMSNAPFESSQHKMEVDRLNKVVDRLIDYYARTINAADTEPRYAQTKAAASAQLTALYKYRHNGTTDGLDDFIANVMNTPLLEP